ncbi:hypothetical protein [Acuticoccus kandeliae]|uniref:hypothetical protein n=1 Tax=Acuticoccus kandeliae TaxID=2073160 RepID=UPI000D3EAB0E|nr:hypothetical protein [Acuticoccus kandeliae]
MTDAPATRPLPSRIGAKLRRLPGDLLVAAINATALLVIVAAVLALVVLGRVENVGSRLAGAAADAVLARLDIEPATLRGDLEAMRANLGAMRESAAGRADASMARMDAALTEIETTLAEMNKTLAALRVAAPELTAIAVREAVQSIAAALPQRALETGPPRE